MDYTNLTAGLADLHVVNIVWFTAVLSAARLAFIRIPGSAVRALVEIVEAALIAGVLVFMVIQPFIVKAFYIPSGSMLPTLIEDDHILVSRFIYRLHQPQHGDVVVFNAPPQALAQTMENITGNEPIDYIKRLIGLPGDTIIVHAGTIQVNNQLYYHDQVRPYFGLSVDDAVSKDEDHLKFTNDGVSVYHDGKWTKYSLYDVAQRLNGSPTTNVHISPGYVERNGQRLDEPYIAEDPDYDAKLAPNGDVILSDPSEGGTRINGAIPDPQTMIQDDKARPGKVPPGEIIVMGDNRNDSNDSSRWGPLDENRLVGRAVCIFYPFGRVQQIR